MPARLSRPSVGRGSPTIQSSLAEIPVVPEKVQAQGRRTPDGL
jgi:hypothetical protein